MTFWLNFWTIVFFTSIGIFAVVAVVVAIGGFKDVKTMLRRLKDNSSSS
ncbi:MAG: hypothetical protein ACI97A_004311 [Planctomycetota bacterium]|jgi:hypothetical protein